MYYHFCCIAGLCGDIIILKDLEKRREFFARLDERVKEARLERSLATPLPPGEMRH